MPASRERGLKRLAFLGLALAAGFGTGLLFQPAGKAGQGEAAGVAGSRDLSALPSPEAGAATRKYDKSRSRDESIHFSRKQWSKLVRSPAVFRLPFGMWMPSTGDPVPVFGDLPIVGRLFQSNRLDAHAGLFGWDENLMKQVDKTLADFAKELAAAEKEGTSLSYPSPGVIRFDFSASRAAREAAVSRLGAELQMVLGRQEAERFIRVSDIEGLASNLDDTYEITARYEGDELRILAPGVAEMVQSRAASAASTFTAVSLQEMLSGRIQHLGMEIDWSRLDPAYQEGKGKP